MKLKNFDMSALHSHGIGILDHPTKPGTIIITAINHRKNGSAVEVFTHKLNTETAEHVETWQDENLIPEPNDVVPLGIDEFLVTSEKPGVSGRWNSELRALRCLTRISTGHVVHRKSDGSSRSVAL